LQKNKLLIYNSFIIKAFYFRTFFQRNGFLKGK
jgi:hypothetical protein